MKKLAVGIVGYGNLGKAIEKKILADSRFKLVAVFSKRNLPNAVDIGRVLEYRDKIDCLFLCGGSQNELEKQAFALVKDFNIVDCYDNHNRLERYVKKLNVEAKKHKRIALCSFGWDPGLFSLMRAMFDGIGLKSYTFWGKGLSQGHTQAIKNISGVKDGLQFTLPNQRERRKIEKGKIVEKSKKLHKRLCYVVADRKDQQEIKRKIVTMPDYFAGYSTQVKFVSQKKLDKLKSFAHQGMVTTRGGVANFSLKLKSNPDFTAAVAVAYSKNIAILQAQKRFGAFTILDLPVSGILDDNKFKFL